MARGEQMAATDATCANCEKTLDDGRLYKCPVCFKLACEEHVYRRSGREFCGSGCAQYFFFGDEDD
jgi:hypothetical protein